MSLANYIANYPDRRDKNFQTSFNEKYEFSSKSSYIGEKLKPGKPSYYNHQELSHRAIRVISKMLVIDKPGTGKTGTVEGFTEEIVNAKKHAKLNPDIIPDELARIKEIFIMVKGNTVKQELISQLVCKFSDGKYEPDPNLYKDLPSAASKNITKSGYRVFTYGEFAKDIAERWGLSGSDLREVFLAQLLDPDNHKVRQFVRATLSDCAFWIDEAHNLILSESATSNHETSIVYQIIHIIFHIVFRPIIILTTATPAVNRYTEFYKLANLIIDADGFLPDDMNPDKLSDEEFDSLFPGFNISRGANRFTASRQLLGSYYKPQIPDNYDGIDYNYINARMRGMITYTRDYSPDFTVKVRTLQKPELQIEEQAAVDKLGLYPIMLSREQSDFYRKLSDEAQNDKFRVADMYASIFIYPQRGTVGYIKSDQGYKNNFDDNGKLLSNSTLKEVFNDRDEMARRGAKLLWIGDVVQTSEGLVIVVCDMIIGSGCNLIEAYLNHLGYSTYDGKESLLTDMSTNEGLGYCGIGKKTSSIVNNLKESKRCAKIIGSNAKTPSIVNNIRNAASSSYNIYGKLLKVVIISKAASEGMSFTGARVITLVNPKWTDSAREQAEARGIRANSYTEIGPILDKAAGRKLDHIINVCRLTSFLDNGEPTSDLHVYETAREKGLLIKQVMKILKRISITCTIHKERNVRPDDVYGSQECDYGDCDYKCSGEKGETDYSTYDIYYAKNDLDPIVDQIVKLFIFESQLTIQQISDFMEGIRYYMLESALIKIVTDKISMRDRYGITTYLMEDNGVFYTSRVYPSDALGRPVSRKYDTGISVIKRRDNVEISDMLHTVPPNIINRIQQGEFNPLSLINGENIHIAVQVIESYFIHLISGLPEVPSINSAMHIFNKYIFHTNEPVGDLRIVDNAIKNAAKTVGRPISENIEEGYTQRLVNKGEILTGNNSVGNKIIYHILYGQRISLGTTNLAANYMNPPKMTNIRIYKYSEGKWRDANLIEIAVYRRMAHNEVMNKIERLIRNKIPNDPAILEGGVLRIPLITVLSDGGVRIIEKISGYAWGKLCYNYTVDQLMLFMARNNILPDNRHILNLNKPKHVVITDIIRFFTQMKAVTLNSYDIETLRKYEMIIDGMASIFSKDNLCDLIVSLMRKYNLEIV